MNDRKNSMRPLLLGLLAVFGCVLAIRATQTPTPLPSPPGGNDNMNGGPETRMLDDRELHGETPSVPPEFDISFEVPGRGNELIIYITEQHGYYVERFRLEIKKKDIDYRLELFYERYLKADDVLVIHEHIVPAELPHFGGDMGTGADWVGVVTRHGLYRAENPDPLPEIVIPP